MIHGRQFALLRDAVSLPGYESCPLPGGWMLSRHKDLPLARSADGRMLLLGIAWQVMPGRQSPQEEMDRLCAAHPGLLPREAILDMEETWCGRYVLIAEQRIYTDACGLLSVFYAPWGVASDCGLLAMAGGREAEIYRPRPGIVMNWMPGPLTHMPDIQKLLASQIYNYQTGTTEERRLTAAGYAPVKDEEERIRAFTDVFCNGLANMRSALPGRKLLLALTGGYDSRTLFALMLKAGLPFDAYTLSYEKIYADDLEIPRLLCQKTGVKHHFVPHEDRPFSKILEAEYLAQTSGLIADQDRVFYARGQYQALTAPFGDAALLRSSVWENVIEYFGRSFTDQGPGEDFYDWFGVAPGSREKQSLEAYFAWCAAHPQEGLTPSNVFLWEQREGCWLSAIEGGFDLMDRAVSLQMANCRYLLSMLLDFPREERLIKEHQARIIRFACPQIADVPFGTDKIAGESAWAVIRQKARRGVDRVRKLGIQKTWRTYAGIVKRRMEKKSLKKKLHREE